MVSEITAVIFKLTNFLFNSFVLQSGSFVNQEDLFFNLPKLITYISILINVILEKKPIDNVLKSFSKHFLIYKSIQSLSIVKYIWLFFCHKPSNENINKLS